MTRLYRSIGIALAATVTLSMISGCPSETGESDPSPENVVLEAATPTVSTTTPAADAANVAADTAVSVTFSRNVARDSLVNPQTNTPTGTLVLKDSTGSEVSGSITYNPATFTATFWPREALVADRRYTAIDRSADEQTGQRFSAAAGGGHDEEGDADSGERRVREGVGHEGAFAEQEECADGAAGCTEQQRAEDDDARVVVAQGDDAEEFLPRGPFPECVGEH